MGVLGTICLLPLFFFRLLYNKQVKSSPIIYLLIYSDICFSLKKSLTWTSGFGTQRQTVYVIDKMAILSNTMSDAVSVSREEKASLFGYVYPSPLRQLHVNLKEHPLAPNVDDHQDQLMKYVFFS